MKITVAASSLSPASMPRFRHIHAGDQGTHCRPWTPASLSLLPGKTKHLGRRERQRLLSVSCHRAGAMVAPAEPSS